MSKGKVVLIIMAVVGLAIAGSVTYVLLNINSLVKGAIEKYGSQATKTEVSVSSVDMQLSQGKATVSGLSVANPRGFSGPDIFRLGTISAKIDVKTISQSPVVIQDIRISGPEVFYEMNKSGTSNLDVLMKNLEGESTTKKQPEQKKEREVKLFIRKLIFENGQVEARIAAFGDKTMILSLPRLELIDIGKNGGATPAEAAKAISMALARETAKVVARSQGEKYLKKGAESLFKRFLEKQ